MAHLHSSTATTPRSSERLVVLILDSLVDESVEAEVLGPNAELRSHVCTAEAPLPDGLEDVGGLIVRTSVPIPAGALGRLSSCRVIVRGGVGYDNVDVEHAGRLGIPVLNVPDYGTNEVADHCLALLLCLWRRIIPLDAALRADPARNWQFDIAGPIRRLTGATLGIVGLGRIGAAVGLRAKAFGLRVAFYDPYLADGYEKTYQLERAASAAALFAAADAVTINAPLTAETRRLFDHALLASSKPGLTLVNGGRGPIVSLDAVYDGLRQGRLAAFGADVLESEPPDATHPLLAAYARGEPWLRGRIALTPHAAFASEEGLRELRSNAARQVLRAARGEPLHNCVNKPFLDQPRARVL
jgi:D-3-phosphoglycerate dehydrogenase/C-terminal binding protein